MHLGIQIWKNRGTAALKSLDTRRAATCYKNAADIAMGPLDGGLLESFVDALDSWPEGSAQVTRSTICFCWKMVTQSTEL